MLALALLLAAEQPSSVPPPENGLAAAVGENHRTLRYAQMIAGLCDVALQSGDVRAFFAKNYPQAATSKSEMDVIATDCAIYGFGRAARQAP
jgi:hypothetical protein